MKKKLLVSSIFGFVFMTSIMSAQADNLDDYIEDYLSGQTPTSLRFVYDTSGWIPDPITVGYTIAQMEADIQVQVDAINEAAIIAAIAAYCAANPSDPDCDF